MKIILIFFLVSILCFGQNNEMSQNSNEMENEFKADVEIKTKFEKTVTSKNGIQILVEKKNDTLICIYLKNQTKDTLNISMQDSHFYLLQEAKNKDGNWKPIEYWNYSWCGNSYVNQKISPDEIIKTESKNYNGNFETEIRFKLLFENKSYYTNSINGKININQFRVPEKASKHYMYRNALRCSGIELAEKIIFLEPNAMIELSKKDKKWQKEMAEKRAKNKK